MNGRILFVAVLNALVAVALAVVLVVLFRQGPGAAAGTPGGVQSGDGPAIERGPDGEVRSAPERPGPAVERSYPPQETAERLKRDLMGRRDLIPFEGTLGGTMDFYDPDSIYILSDRWVYAQFDDGHVQGGMLLEYTIDPGGEISWRVLETRLE